MGSIPTYSRHFLLPGGRNMNKNELLRRLPKIDEVLKEESLVVLSEEKGSLSVTEAVRAVIAYMRQNIL